jgi:hypothetical protein
MSSPETPTPVATTRRTTRGTPYSPVYGAEACLPSETLLGSPRVKSFDKSVRSGHSVRMWTPSANIEGKQRPKMHVATRRPGATNGSCIVGNPGSGPSPMASTEPRRVP